MAVQESDRRDLSHDGSAYDDVSDMVSPPGLPDLGDSDVARSLPLAALSLAVVAAGHVASEYLSNYRDDPSNADALAALDAFGEWAVQQVAAGDPNSWIGYLSSTRENLVDRAFAAYFPEEDIPDEVRDYAGDDLLGSALWFSFLSDVGAISDDDETTWLNLWMFLTMTEFFAAPNDEESVAADSPATPMGDEW